MGGDPGARPRTDTIRRNRRVLSTDVPFWSSWQISPFLRSSGGCVGKVVELCFERQRQTSFYGLRRREQPVNITRRVAQQVVNLLLGLEARSQARLLVGRHELDATGKRAANQRVATTTERCRRTRPSTAEAILSASLSSFSRRSVTSCDTAAGELRFCLSLSACLRCYVTSVSNSFCD